MISLILINILLVQHFKPITSIAGGFRAHYMPQSKGIVMIDNGFGFAYPPFCAGALISSWIVLTNGNCCSGSMRRTSIHLGSFRPFESGQFFFVHKYEIIGQAHSSHFTLCVIRLDREVVFDKESVAPLGIPSALDTYADDNQIYYFHGYGSTQMFEAETEEERQRQNPIHQREMSDDLMAIELPHVGNWHCERYFGKHFVGSWKLNCFGYTTGDRSKRLMFDDNGAPFVGKSDRLVYGIAATYVALLEGGNWQMDVFPNYVIDVKSARLDIFRAMRVLMQPDESKAKHKTN